MASTPTSKKIGTGMGARGGSRTGHRSGVRPNSAFAPRSKAYSARVGTKGEQQDVAKSRSEILGVGQLDAHTQISGDDAEKEMDYRTASSHPHHSASLRRQQQCDPAIAVACNASRSRLRIHGYDGASGIMHGISTLSTSSSDYRNHGIDDGKDDNKAAQLKVLSQTNTGPLPQKIPLVKRIYNMKNLDKKRKKMKEEPDRSANDDFYIGLAATYKGLSAEGDLGTLFKAGPSSRLPAHLQFSETGSTWSHDFTEVFDSSYLSEHRQLTESLRQRYPQSSAASTRSIVTTRSAATTQSIASTNSSNAAATSGFSSQYSLATNEKNTNIPSDDEQSDGEDNTPSKQLQKSVPRFVCPFRMHDPIKYSGGSCAFSSWDKISRMKEHLYRRHTRICQICHYAFTSKKELDSHTSQAEGCEPRIGATEGVTDDMKQRLRSRKKYSSNQSDREHWEEIYQILFPDDDDIPWPYVETNQHESSGPFDSRLASIKKYLQREMQHLVHNGEETQNLGEDHKGGLLQNMLDCLEKAFAPYGPSGGPPTIPIDVLANPLSSQYDEYKTVTPSGRSLFPLEEVDDVITSACQMPSDQHMSVLLRMQDARYPSLNPAPPNANTYSEPCSKIGAMQYPSNPNISKHNFSVMDDPEIPYEKMGNSTYNYAAPQDFNANITMETPLEESGSWYNGDSLDFTDIMQDVAFALEMSNFKASGFQGSANEGIEEYR